MRPPIDTLEQALFWVRDNCTIDAVRRLRSRAVAKLLHDELKRVTAERDAAVADADLHRTRCASILFSGAMDDKLAGDVQGWVRDYVDAKAERDALLADAERYRWLRGKDTGPAAIWETIDSVNGQLTLKCEGELDAAIDAARGAA